LLLELRHSSLSHAALVKLPFLSFRGCARAVVCSESTVVPLLTLAIDHVSHVTIDLVSNVAVVVVVVVVAAAAECNDESIAF